MKTLEEEAKDLSLNYFPSYPDGIITDEIRTLREGFEKGVYAGANSKYVQAEKIKAQIDVLKKIISSGYKFKNTLGDAENKLLSLEQQLKQLEDDK